VPIPISQGQNDDRRFAVMALQEARKSVPEEDGRPHPKVGAVVVKNGKVLSTAYRGERPENHAEYIALEKKLADEAVAGATVYTTLEPCTTRTHPKIPCADRLIERKVARVVTGMLDPDDRISGKGLRKLRKAGIVTDLFPHDLAMEVEELNREFTRYCEQQGKTLKPVTSSQAPKRTGRTKVTTRSQTSGKRSSAIAAGRDIHFNYGATPATEASVRSAASRKRAVAAPNPNLQYVTSKEKRVFVSRFAFAGISDPRDQKEREKSLQALVLKFENRPLANRQIARASNVIAQIRFKSTDGTRQRVIDYGVWLNSSRNSTDMEVGDTRELVLISVMDGKLVAFEDRREENHSFHDEFSYIEDGDVSGLEMVEVTLIDKKTQTTLNCKFRVWREGARFCVS
jgi:pyrimidine deaminase RibD-like protein